MRAGDLRHKLIVQKPTETQGSMGDMALTWTEYDEVWASRTPLGGTETLAAGGLLTDAREELAIRYRAGVTPKMRLLARVEDTTLNGAIVVTDLVLTVASSDGFPLEGEFTIQIESELLTVTAGQGTTSWAVTRAVDGTTAASHADAITLHRMAVIDIETVVDPTGARSEMKLTGVVHG